MIVMFTAVVWFFLFTALLNLAAASFKITFGKTCGKRTQLRNRKYLVEMVQYKLSIINGTAHNPTFDKDIIEELIKNFETKESDVFICTYVKSGTTFTQQIVNLLMNEGRTPEKAYTAAIPWLEAAATGGILGDREATGWTMESIKSNLGPRYFKTHASTHDIPGGFESKAKVIYVARNPKDVLVSLYFHAKNKPEFEFNGTFNDMFEHFIAGTCENGSWFTHVLEWWNAHKKYPKRVLFLQYEAMLKDPIESVRKIANFIELPATPEILELVVSKSTIDEMKKDTKAASAVGFDHLRQGGAGKWRESFTVRQNDIFDDAYKKAMEGSGLTFDFGEGLTM